MSDPYDDDDHEIEFLLPEWVPGDLDVHDIEWPDVDPHDALDEVQRDIETASLVFPALRYLYTHGGHQHIDTLWVSVIYTAVQRQQAALLAEVREPDQSKGMSPLQALSAGGNTILRPLVHVTPMRFATMFKSMVYDVNPDNPLAEPALMLPGETGNVEAPPMAPNLVWNPNPVLWCAVAKALAAVLATGRTLRFAPDAPPSDDPRAPDADTWHLARVIATSRRIPEGAAMSILQGIMVRAMRPNARLAHPSEPGEPWTPAPTGDFLALEGGASVDADGHKMYFLRADGYQAGEGTSTPPVAISGGAWGTTIPEA